MVHSNMRVTSMKTVDLPSFFPMRPAAATFRTSIEASAALQPDVVAKHTSKLDAIVPFLTDPPGLLAKSDFESLP